MLWYPGCAGWHGGVIGSWVSSTSGFYRGGSGVFSFSGNIDWNGNNYMGRGVAVVGTGL